MQLLLISFLIQYTNFIIKFYKFKKLNDFNFYKFVVFIIEPKAIKFMRQVINKHLKTKEVCRKGKQKTEIINKNNIYMHE